MIGGTGLISTQVSACLLSQPGVQLTLLNRGNSPASLEGVRALTADIRDPQATRKALQGEDFDVVIDWIAFTPAHVQADIDLFSNHCSQYIFISSASAYEKPSRSPFIRESTPLGNPFWQYSQDKADCESLLEKANREQRFPYTIVRPAHTYGSGKLPFPLAAPKLYTPIDSLLRHLPIVVPGDGTSIWTVTHTIDFARAFVALVGQYKAIGQAYHITSNELLTWNQIIGTIGHELGVEPVLISVPSVRIEQLLPKYKGSLLGDKANSAIYDNSKISELAPHWHCRISLQQGVRLALEYYEEHPEQKQVSEDYQSNMAMLAEKFA
jgi:nucleoside-diphosphate-sugar epimerase